jgi:hypothetical protein
MRIVVGGHDPNWRTCGSQSRDRLVQSIGPGRRHTKLVSHPPVYVDAVTILKVPEKDVWLLKLVIGDLNAGACGNISSQAAEVGQT